MSQLSLPFFTARGALEPVARSAVEAVARPAPLEPAARPAALVAEAPQFEPGQLPGPLPIEPARLAGEAAARLTQLAGEPVCVELTDNAWTMVSYRRIDGLLRFRLHHMFCGAPEPVWRAIAGFTGRARRVHGRVIDAYIRAHRALIKPLPQRPQHSMATRGRVHDLADIYAQLNAQQFEGKVSARIGWGRRAPGGRRRSIKMGVYFHEQKLIRIHPALDDERVPRHFVELVVFHEMLHQTIPPREGFGGRRCVHGPEFRAAERRFPGYERARAWEKAHLHLLLQKR